jgi:lipopolysaccharide export system permease protein
MTLARYITRLFLARFAFILVVLAALLQIVDLLDNAGTALERGGALTLLIYAALRLPSIVDQVVPISVLLAASLTLLALVQSNEIVAMRSFGVTVYRIVATIVVAALGIAAAHFVLGDQIAPRTERKFRDWWATVGPEPPQPGTRLWLRDGATAVGVDSVDDGGRLLHGVRLILRDAQGQLTALIVADRAEIRDDAWVLVDVRRTDLVPAGVRTDALQSQIWSTRLTPANFAELLAPTERLSVGHLRDILTGTWAGLRGRQFYEARLHRKFAFPAASLVMVLLAAPAAHGTRRRGTMLYGLALGIAAGLFYLFAEAFMLAIGQAGVLPASLAVWAPVLLFASAGAAVLVHLEG